MRRFLLELSLYAIAAFVLAAVMDRMVCTGLLKMEDYRFQDYAAMLQGGMEHDILIMGNSRGKSHYDTALIDSLAHVSSFCIGAGGYPLPIQQLKYHLYREHNQKPRVIIEDIDFMCFRDIDDIRHQHQSEQFFPLVYDPTMRQELKRFGYGFMELNIPMFRMYGYQQVIKNGLLEALHLKHYVSRPAYKGHRAEEGDWNGEELRKMSADSILTEASVQKMFVDFLEQCAKDSIQVVLGHSPVYFEAKEKLIGLDSLRSYFANTAEKYGTLYLDYLDHPISLDSNNFCVAIHMNPDATQAFTEQLCQDLAIFE